MDDDLGELFLRAARRVRRGEGAWLAPLGLTPAQARVLRVIERSAAPPRMVDLADRLEIVPRSVTALVDALEAAGLVRREPDPASRRSTLIVITPEGRRVRDRMREARREATEALFAPLTPTQRQTLHDLLEIVDTHAATPERA